MSHRRQRQGVSPLRVVLAAAGWLVVSAPAAQAALGLTLSPVNVGTLRPGQTTVAGATNVVVTGALTDSSWKLSVRDASGLSTAGRMVRQSATAPCNGGAAALAQPLHLAVSRTLVTTTVDQASLDLGSSSVQIAHGSVLDTVSVVYSQAVGLTEQLVGGCTYGLTITYTVAAGP